MQKSQSKSPEDIVCFEFNPVDVEKIGFKKIVCMIWEFLKLKKVKFGKFELTHLHEALPQINIPTDDNFPYYTLDFGKWLKLEKIGVLLFVDEYKDLSCKLFINEMGCIQNLLYAFAGVTHSGTIHGLSEVSPDERLTKN